MAEVTNFQRQKLATFNSALGVVIRINSILNNCWVASKNLDAYSWYYELRSLEKECWPKLEETSRTEIDRKIKDLKIRINQWLKKANRGEPVGIPGDLYDELDNLEKQLRLAADKADLLVPDKKDVMDMIGQV